MTSGFGRCPLSVVPTFDRSTTIVTFIAFIVHHRINQVEVTHFHRILHLARVRTWNYNQYDGWTARQTLFCMSMCSCFCWFHTTMDLIYFHMLSYLSQWRIQYFSDGWGGGGGVQLQEGGGGWKLHENEEIWAERGRASPTHPRSANVSNHPV